MPQEVLQQHNIALYYSIYFIHILLTFPNFDLNIYSSTVLEYRDIDAFVISPTPTAYVVAVVLSIAL